MNSSWKSFRHGIHAGISAVLILCSIPTGHAQEATLKTIDTGKTTFPANMSGLPSHLFGAMTGEQGGLVAHVSFGNPIRQALTTTHLRRNKRCVVHALYQGPATIEEFRREIEKQIDDGSVTAESWSGTYLPYASGIVNRLVATDAKDLTDQEILRVLVPGGIALVYQGSKLRQIDKPRPDTIDDWSHFLYGPDNNAVSNDRVVGPPHRLQWVAPPLNARHHESLGTVSVAVSSGGKLFYIIDESPTASILIPPAWALVARDAFNGIVLWKRTIPKWEDHLRGFRSGPPELSRTLVAAPDRVYVTLSQRASVSALDPATGETLQEYPATKGAEEILFSDGILYLATRQSDDAEGTRGLMAVDAGSGRTIWQLPDADPLSMSLTVSGGRVAYMTLQGVHCLDAADGNSVWSTPRDVIAKRPGWSSPTVVMHDGVVLVADRWTEMKDTMDEVTGKPVARWLAQEGWTGDLIAYSAATGKELWQCRCAESYHGPPDVFVADGLVWIGQSRSRTGPDFVAGRDPRTGEVKRELETGKAWDTTMPHHRCHRNRATQQYIITGRTGVEFIDVATGDSRRHHWTRGTCQFGTLPANGLLYLPPHSCACFIEAKLTGFLALAPRAGQGSGEGEAAKAGQRLQRGPKYGAAAGSSSVKEDEWPTYRHDAIRSGYTPQQISAEIGSLWELDLGSKISSPIIAAGKVFVATIDRHRVHAVDTATGKTSWTFAAGGRIDSPPTFTAGRVVFGSADGFVYCLDADSGEMVWRFRAAPQQRRIIAFGQLESTWPVHGSVLILDGAVYCVAGRSSYLDGGLFLYQLDLATGSVLAERTVYSRDPETGEQPEEPIMFEMPGALPDVLASDGQSVYMRRLAFDRETLESREAGKHVYSPAGFLNDNWWHRNYWIDGTHFYSGYIGWYFAGREAPAGRLLTFTDAELFGYGYAPDYYRGSTGRKYNLFALDRAVQPEQPPADYQRANRDYPHSGARKFGISYRWSQQLPMLVRSMVLTEDKLFVAGPPENALNDMQVFAGEKGGRLSVVSTTDGTVLKDYELDALPVYDGMAAAGGKLFVSFQDGRLACLGLDGRANTTIHATKPLEERLPPLEIVKAPGLAGYWKLDEGEGNLARDSSGGGHTGKVTGSWATGEFGTCIETDGTPAVVTIADGPHLHPGTGDFTVEMWVNLEGHDCRILGKEAFPKTWWVINVLANGRAEMVLGQGTGNGRQVRPTSETRLPLDTWTHLAYVIDRQQQTVRCYLDGRLDSTTAIPAPLSDTDFDVKGTDLRIPSSHKPFRGLFDELKFWQRALTEQEIAKSYESSEN